MSNTEPANRVSTLHTFTDWVRQIFSFVLTPLAEYIVKIGIHPNVLTFSGLVGNMIGAYFLSQGNFLWGGIIILVMGPIDALDGATARAKGVITPWGAFVDSTSDRWSESVIMLGLLVHYATTNAAQSTVLVLLALVGSLMVSYTRARAEALGFKANVGVMTRLERYLVLAPALLFNHPEIALWIIAPLANITAVQRVLHVR
ncbi:MAG: CDP-alcohol phosphatidyltransferase family protein, partial [Anaerolineales bacterium]